MKWFHIVGLILLLFLGYLRAEADLAQNQALETQPKESVKDFIEADPEEASEVAESPVDSQSDDDQAPPANPVPVPPALKIPATIKPMSRPPKPTDSAAIDSEDDPDNPVPTQTLKAPSPTKPLPQASKPKHIDSAADDLDEEQETDSDAAGEEEEEEFLEKPEVIKPRADLVEQASQAKDGAEKLTLLGEAAAAGNDDALYQLGLIFMDGEIVPRSFDRAAEYFQQAATYGNPDAQHELGFLYSTGRGVPANVPLSLLYHSFAAQGGNLLSKLTLAYRFNHGYNVAPSCSKAVEKFSEVSLHFLNETGELFFLFPVTHKRLSDRSEPKDSNTIADNEIVEYYRFNAQTGDISSQVTLGAMYLHGKYGVAKDYAEAFKYFKLAADAKDPGGLSYLGLLYLRGLGVAKDTEAAIKLLKQAGSHPNAQTLMGEMYLRGTSPFPKSPQTAKDYFHKAAEQGWFKAQLHLGDLWADGRLGQVDYARAFQYYSLAGHQGHPRAMIQMAKMHEKGLGATQSCPMAAALYVRVLSRSDWFARGLKKGYALYETGDLDGSLLQYERLAEHGFEVAQSNAAYLHEHHAVNSNSSRRAIYFYKHAAEQSNPLALLKLGDYHYYGTGVAKDLEKAVGFYKSASELNNAQAMFNLGSMHQFGQGLPVDVHLAKRYYDMAIQATPEAALPSYLALASLAAQYFYHILFVEPTTTTILGTELSWDTLLILVMAFLLGLAVVIRQRFLL